VLQCVATRCSMLLCVAVMVGEVAHEDCAREVVGASQCVAA